MDLFYRSDDLGFSNVILIIYHLKIEGPDLTTRHPPDPPLGKLARDYFNRRALDQADNSRPGEAWRRLYEELAPLIRSHAARGRRGAVDPEDAVQEAWLLVIARIRHFRYGDEKADFSNWLATALRNRLSNLERNALMNHRASLEDANVEALVGHEECPSESYERARLRTLVREALEEVRSCMPVASHRVMMLRWIEGRTVPEIAEALGMTAAQVRDRHRRALPLLRLLLSRRLTQDRRPGMVMP